MQSHVATTPQIVIILGMVWLGIALVLVALSEAEDRIIKAIEKRDARTEHID